MVPLAVLEENNIADDEAPQMPAPLFVPKPKPAEIRNQVQEPSEPEIDIKKMRKALRKIKEFDDGKNFVFNWKDLTFRKKGQEESDGKTFDIEKLRLMKNVLKWKQKPEFADIEFDI